MRLDTEFIKLPITFDPERLANEVALFAEEDWRPHPQGHPGNSALPLVSSGGDPANDSTKGAMRGTPHLDRCPYLQRVLASFETVIGRTRLMRLDGNAEATPHTDTNYYWIERARVHIPIVTTPRVLFVCGEKSLHMAPGEAWIFDTWKTHNVLNPDPTRRVHLVIDTIGSAAFQGLIERGERPFARQDAGAMRALANGNGNAGRATHITYEPGFQPKLTFEAVNRPVVMSPWEQKALIRLLKEDLVPSNACPAPLAAELDKLLERFNADWQARWAAWGDAPAAWTAYKEALANLEGRLASFNGRLQLQNGSDAAEIARQFLTRPALNPDLAGLSRPGPASEFPAAARKAGTSSHRTEPRFDRPIFLVSSPRSGSSLLFETLSKAPALYTIGGESHEVIEGIGKLHPATRDWDSNRLSAEDAEESTVQALIERLRQRLVDRDRRPVSNPDTQIRILEKTPKNALRVPFFAAAFPDAFFVYLYRDPRETISSMLDAWKSGRFVTYPELPGWEGPPWSLLLVPGWRSLSGRPLPEIVARQWVVTTTALLDDLEALSPDRWCVASYDRLVSEPQTEIKRLCDFVGLDWDLVLNAPLPPSRHTLTSPEPEKWRHNGEALAPVLPLVEPVANRARELFARPPAVLSRKRLARERPPVRSTQEDRPASDAAGPAPATGSFQSVFTDGFPKLLEELGASLLVSTYQSGRLIAVRADGGGVNTHFRAFPSPMGIAVGRHGLALGTQRHIWEYRNQPEVGRKLGPPGKHDACFLPHRSHVTGDIRVHELAFAGSELWVVNTRFSCLATLDGAHSFVPRWRPKFVRALAPEDRCHLNGLAIAEGRPRYATALGATGTPQGWREAKATGGVLLDVETHEVIAAGLSMPHSPRVHAGRLWVLESGKGEVGIVDLKSGRVDTVARLPGFTRGLAFAFPYAFVGLSQVRESNIFGGLPLADRVKEKRCGVWALDTRTGRVLGFLRFEGLVQEIFDVQVLRGIRYPEIAEPDSELIAGAFTLPAEALPQVARMG